VIHPSPDQELERGRGSYIAEFGRDGEVQGKMVKRKCCEEAREKGGDNT